MRKKLMFSLKLLLLIGIIFGSIISCNKDLGINSNSDAMKIRSISNEATMHEPDYEYLGKSFYEYVKNHRAYISPQEYCLPSGLRESFNQKFDSLSNLVKGKSYAEVLDFLYLSGYISEELKNRRLEIFNELIKPNTNVINYLESTFQQIDSYDLKTDDKYILKEELLIYKYAYLYYLEITSNITDTLITLRDDRDCNWDWKEILYAMGEGMAVGAAIGTIIEPVVGTAIGTLFGGFIGMGIGELREEKKSIFCINCIPVGLSHRFTGNCDNSAYFEPIAGKHAYEFKWDIINGYPETATTVPGQELLITQTIHGKVLAIRVTSHCHWNEDTDLLASYETEEPYDLFEEQAEVAFGALFFIGNDLFKFPTPQSNNYNNYSYTKTVTYQLSGLAILYPNMYSFGLANTPNENVESALLNGTELTVTWKVDAAHWAEFYGDGEYGETFGKVHLLVSNNCPNGKQLIIPLESTITHGHP